MSKPLKFVIIDNFLGVILGVIFIYDMHQKHIGTKNRL